MPIFEYGCPNCRRIYSFLIRGSARRSPRCPGCGSGGMKRFYSTFAHPRSEESRLERLADPDNFAGLAENDPRAMARMMRKMADEAGEDLDDEMREVVERLEAGEDPERLNQLLDGESDGEEGGGGGYTRQSGLY